MVVFALMGNGLDAITVTGAREVVSYHTWDFKDGKIIAGGDYLDAGGLLASLTQEDETEE